MRVCVVGRKVSLYLFIRDRGLITKQINPETHKLVDREMYEEKCAPRVTLDWISPAQRTHLIHLYSYICLAEQKYM